MIDAENLTTAIVPTYEPETALLDNLTSLLLQVQRVVLVDDGSSPECMGVLASAERMGATVLYLGENRGIAHAINQAATYVFTNSDAEFVLTIDQDSKLGCDYVEHALLTYRAAVSADVHVGAITASHIATWESSTEGSLNGFDVAAEPIQSGMLVSRSAWQSVGALDEALFIDGVDEDFVLRMRKSGWETLIGESCVIEHSLGDRTIPTMFGKPIKVGSKTLNFSFHSPKRRYYITRNRLILFRRHTWRFPRWALRKIIAEAKSFALCLAFGNSRREQLRAFVGGLMDGVAGVGGRISDARTDSIFR